MHLNKQQNKKTYFLKEVLKFKDALITPSPSKIIYCYKEWQSTFVINSKYKFKLYGYFQKS